MKKINFRLPFLQQAMIASCLIAFTLFTQAQVVVIDPGHGYDSNGNNVDGRTTTEIYTALSAGLKLRDLINGNNCGWTVHMTRTTNGNGGWSSVSQRAAMSNSWNATRFISIHCNAGGGTGTETFYCNQSASNTADDNAFANTIQDDMVYHGQWNDRRCVEDNSYLPYHLGVLRTNNAPACLSEIGFVDSGDETKLLSDYWRDKFALAYYTSLQDELGTCSGGSSNGNIAPLGSLFSVTSELSSSYSATKAFDNTVNTRWNSNGADATNYFIIQLDDYYNINQFKVKHASSAGLSANLNTERFYILYWNGAWTQAVTNYNNSSKASVTTHDVNINTQYICLYVTDPTFTSDIYSRIPEFEAYGAPARIAGTAGKNGIPTEPDFSAFSDVSLSNISIQAQPNIVKNGFTNFEIKMQENTEATLEVINQKGLVVKTINSTIYAEGYNNIKMDLSDLSAGVYFYRLRNFDGQSENQKLVIF